MTHITDYHHMFKIVVIGDSGVGKTCLLTRFADDTFLNSTPTTICIDFQSRKINIQGRVVKLQLWDTAGQERFRTIVSGYYRRAHGILLAYDTTNLSTFDNLSYWMQEVKRQAPSSCPVVLVGTKTDLKAQRAVPEEAVRAFAEQYCGGANSLVETSAKTNEGVDYAFQLLAEQIFQRAGNSERAVEPPSLREAQTPERYSCTC